jgi:hypothetical protein
MTYHSIHLMGIKGNMAPLLSCWFLVTVIGITRLSLALHWGLEDQLRWATNLKVAGRKAVMRYCREHSQWEGSSDLAGKGKTSVFSCHVEIFWRMQGSYASPCARSDNWNQFGVRYYRLAIFCGGGFGRSEKKPWSIGPINEQTLFL